MFGELMKWNPSQELSAGTVISTICLVASSTQLTDGRSRFRSTKKIKK